MEVAMTRIAIRRTLFALAAVALVSAFVAVGSSPALSDQQGTILSHNLKSSQAVINGPRQPNTPKRLAAKKGTLNGQGAPHATVKKPRTPKGLITQRRPPVACDCTNCSAAHCNLHLENATNLMGW
jgi:hypothetical protein